jgi:CDGSH-type Zn-finger protein
MSLYCYCKRTETPPFCDGSHNLPRPRPVPEAEPAPDAAAPAAPENSSENPGNPRS